MLVAAPTLINIGRLKYGTKHTMEYLITNTYPTEIHIDQIVAGCTACTKVTMDKNSLSTNETAILKAVFTPGYLGLQTKTISIIAFAGTSLIPVLKIKFKANVHE